MLPMKPRRQDAATLIWEYLDGDISPTRAEALSSQLAERAQVRDQLAESAVMHSMLSSLFTQEMFGDATHSLPGGIGAQPAGKRKTRRFSAA